MPPLPEHHWAMSSHFRQPPSSLSCAAPRRASHWPPVHRQPSSPYQRRREILASPRSSAPLTEPARSSLRAASRPQAWARSARSPRALARPRAFFQAPDSSLLVSAVPLAVEPTRLQPEPANSLLVSS